MKLFLRLCIILFSIGSISINFGQNNQYKLPDDLKNKPLVEILVAAISKKDLDLMNFVVQQTKKERNYILQADTYYWMALLHNDINRLAYADSIIQLKDRVSTKSHPSNAYYLKGKYLLEQKNFSKAIDNFIAAYDSAKEFGNDEAIFKSSHALGITKGLIGDDEEAITINRRNLNYIEELNQHKVSNKDYLRTVFSISAAYNRLKKIDSAFYYINDGIKKSLDFKEREQYHAFVLIAAETLFISGDYNRSIDSLLKVKPFYEKANDSSKFSVMNYYLARNYLNLGEEEKAISLLKKIDTIFQLHKDISARVQESYDLLKNIYEEKKDFKKQLLYTEKLISLKDTIHQNELYLNQKITNEYNIPALEASRQDLIKRINKLEQGNRLSKVKMYGIIMFSLIVLIALIFVNRKQRLYKRRFEELIQNDSKVNDTTNQSVTLEKKETKLLTISDDVIHDILRNLEKFEKNLGFLDTKLSINRLAKKMKTNPNYLSKVINHYKQTSFTKYINNLRIEYCVHQLKENSMYQKFTIQAIANEFGFNTPEAFSRAFYAKNGIKPFFFIKQLIKSENHNRYS